jgi:hypothetical protein
MHGRVLRYFSILPLLIVPAVAQTDQPARIRALTYSPWAKNCFADTCTTGRKGERTMNAGPPFRPRLSSDKET